MIHHFVEKTSYTWNCNPFVTSKKGIPKHVGCAVIFGLMEGFLLISGYIYSMSKYN